MTLMQERMGTFCRLDKTTTPDGYGGTNIVYRDGAEFQAVATMLESKELEIAYQSGQKRIYVIFCTPSVGLEQNDRVKRLQDGMIFRINATPDINQTSVASKIGLCRTTMEVISV